MPDWPSTVASTTQARLEEAVVFFLEETEAGRAIDVTELLSRYRDVEPQLRRFLADQGALQGAVTPLFHQPDGPPPDEPLLESFRNYRVLGLAGKGGVGAVFRARDYVLNRDLAIKVLHHRHAAHADMVQRFIAEAQISAQLQHPGIVPVHEVGQLEDALKRPYFTMKLVKGDTLAQLLSGRPDAGHELPRFVAIFGQVCQAVAYAHSKEVLHRDLKPGNVMLGPFGETLVMDWGLGRVLGEAVDELASTVVPEGSVVRTVREGDTDRTFGALGTYRYMPPEQATNQQHLVSRRSDVFGLGAVLCEILTGQPPYTGRTPEELKARCEKADLAEAYARLDACGADARLIGLAKACLRVDPKERPADAAAVAAEVAAYQDGVREELLQASHRATAAEASAISERRKRDWQFVALTVGFLVFAVATLAGGVVAYNLQQRKGRASREVVALLTRAEVLHGEADRLPAEQALARHEQAREVVARAAVLGRDAGLSEDTRALLRHWQKQTDESLERTRREAAFLHDLDEAAQAGGLRVVDQRPDRAEMVRRYHRAFTAHAPGLLAHPPADAALAGFTPAARRRVAEALDHWGLLDRARAQALFAAAGMLDGDPVRQSIREQWEKPTRLAELAGKVSKSPASALLLARALARAGRAADAIEALRVAQRQDPSAFWINVELGNALVARGGDGPREAAEFYRAAIAVLPGGALAWNNLGMAYFAQLRCGEADEAFARAAALQPGNVLAYCARATVALTKRQDFEAAEGLLREALRHDPDHAGAKAMLALALLSQGKRREADDWLEEAKKAPDDLLVLTNLFACYGTMNRLPTAAAAARRIVKLLDAPGTPHSAQFEASALLFDGHLTEAEKVASEGLERCRHPMFQGPLLVVLAMAECWQGRPGDAESHIREAIKIAPEAGYYRYLLAHMQLWQGKTRQARQTLDQLRALPGQQAGWLRDLVFEKLLPSDEEMARVEKGELELSEYTRNQQAEVALAMGKPYLAYTLFLAKPDGSNSAELWMARLPSLLWNDPGTLTFSHRFNAARAAAMAGCGLGKELHPAPIADRPQLRAKALGWLRDELKERKQAAGSLIEQPKVRRFLNYCRLSPEFAAVRKSESLAELPEQERREWEAFWKEVEALLAKMQKDAPGGK